MAILVGLLAGAAAGMNWLAAAEHPESFTLVQIMQWIGGGAIFFAVALPILQGLTHKLLLRWIPWPDARRRFLCLDAFTPLVFLATFAGAVGVRFVAPVIACVLLLYLLLKGVALLLALSSDQRRQIGSSLGWLAFLFLISGFAALIYQIVWQRVLFGAFGVNIESITIIVSLFMFGLGVGSLVGGVLAARYPDRAPLLFLVCELGIGAFGIVSLPLIAAVSAATLHGSLLSVSLAIFGLLCLPTMLMGATLPILVNHLYRYYQNVGKSVGMLYCINTLGSAIACFLTADLLFVFFGQQTAVLIAAACNVTVGVLVSRYASGLRSVTLEKVDSR